MGVKYRGLLHHFYLFLTKQMDKVQLQIVRKPELRWLEVLILQPSWMLCCTLYPWETGIALKTASEFHTHKAFHELFVFIYIPSNSTEHAIDLISLLQQRPGTGAKLIHLNNWDLCKL